MNTWVHREGERNTDMVRFEGNPVFEERVFARLESWQHDFARYDAIWIISIQPVSWANWDWKRVGVIRTEQYGPATVLARFVNTLPDGREEWRAHASWSETLFSDSAIQQRFLVWYQDGLGHTYFDDNNEELYAPRFL